VLLPFLGFFIAIGLLILAQGARLIPGFWKKPAKTDSKKAWQNWLFKKAWQNWLET
jgi:hypothetical protein